MLLDALRDFEWLNEPLDVNFEETGMRVLTHNKTDFWQSAHHRVAKDNGHFFYTRRFDDFSFVVGWRFRIEGRFDQCGIMLRIDEKNWFKASIMYESPQYPMIGSCENIDIPTGIEQMYYKIKRYKGDYIISYSYDGINFRQMRLLHLLKDQPEVKVGAFICSPQHEGFEATLTRIEFLE